MKTKNLFMPLALISGMFVSLFSYGAVNQNITPSGIPFTARYLKEHHFVAKSNNFFSNGVYMYFGATQSGLYDDWNITVSNENFSYTWRTSDSSQGYIDNYFTSYHSFTSYTSGAGFIPAGTYNVTIQCNSSGAYRDDITVAGDNNTFDSVQDYNAYNNAFVATGIEVVNGGDGISIATTTNY